MTVPKIFLKSHHDERILRGHLWVFSNEIERAEPAEPGSIVDIIAGNQAFLGRGFYNPHSLISARILTSQKEEIDGPFFKGRLERALKIRTEIYPNDSSYRMVFGESDFLPGLVIDRFGQCFVVQSYCLGMDVLMPLVIESLKNDFGAESIVKKNDSPIRVLENLKEEVEVVAGEMTLPLEIDQDWNGNKLRFTVDPVQGQKSGFFFDQRENRERLGSYAKNKKVLDCFSYTGGFSVYAAKAGAQEVTAVDSSDPALTILQKNALLNEVRINALHSDVDEALRRFQAEKRKFDIIVLDPPALAKSRKNLFGAIRKYRKLNEMALGLLERDGIMVSCSCSHHVSRQDFVQMLGEAAKSEEHLAQILELRGASRDHPVLPSMPETEYLKCAVMKVN